MWVTRGTPKVRAGPVTTWPATSTVQRTTGPCPGSDRNWGPCRMRRGETGGWGGGGLGGGHGVTQTVTKGRKGRVTHRYKPWAKRIVHAPAPHRWCSREQRTQETQRSTAHTCSAASEAVSKTLGTGAPFQRTTPIRVLVQGAEAGGPNPRPLTVTLAPPGPCPCNGDGRYLWGRVRRDLGAGWGALPCDRQGPGVP
jgi:hypothetical protein